MREIIYAFLSVIGLGISVVCQVCICRYAKNIGLLKSVLGGFIAGMVGMLIIERYYSGSIAFVLVNLIAYTSLEYCYFAFINLGETAIRIRILRELTDAPSGLSLEDLLRLYNTKKILGKRLNRLLNNGQIICKDNRYYIGKPVMLFIAKLILLLRLFILSRDSKSAPTLRHKK
jgi:hypothetical protein